MTYVTQFAGHSFSACIHSPGWQQKLCVNMVSATIQSPMPNFFIGRWARFSSRQRNRGPGSVTPSSDRLPNSTRGFAQGKEAETDVSSASQAEEEAGRKSKQRQGRKSHCYKLRSMETMRKAIQILKPDPTNSRLGVRAVMMVGMAPARAAEVLFMSPPVLATANFWNGEPS